MTDGHILTQSDTALSALSDAQLSAIVCLVSGMSLAATCHELDISRETLRRWRYDNAPFKAEYERARRLLYEQQHQAIADTLTQAIDLLAGVFDGTVERIPPPKRAELAVKFLAASLPYRDGGAYG